jgi:hypothetical protein
MSRARPPPYEFAPFESLRDDEVALQSANELPNMMKLLLSTVELPSKVLFMPYEYE